MSTYLITVKEYDWVHDPIDAESPIEALRQSGAAVEADVDFLVYELNGPPTKFTTAVDVQEVS